MTECGKKALAQSALQIISQVQKLDDVWGLYAQPSLFGIVTNGLEWFIVSHETGKLNCRYKRHSKSPSDANRMVSTIGKYKPSVKNLTMKAQMVVVRGFAKLSFASNATTMDESMAIEKHSMT